MPVSLLPEAHGLRYQANCAALAEVDTQLVERLDSTPIPPGVEAVLGRDGCQTLRLMAGEGGDRWFGDSSMPAVSSEALFGQYSPPGGNVLLPGVGTGREALVLAGRLPHHCAVLIYEADPAAIKLAFGLCDYADAIRHRRMVFFTGRELGEALSDVLAAWPGLEFPQQLLPLPGHDAAAVEGLRLTVEAAGQQVRAHQTALAGAASQRLAEHTADPASERPRLAVISRDPRPEVADVVGRIVETLKEWGWPAAGCTPFRPDACHAVARLQLLADHRPDGVLLINCLPGPLTTCLPKALPVCSWFVSADSAPVHIADPIDGFRPIFAAGTNLVQALIGAGADRQQVHLLEPATDPQTFKPVDLDDTQLQRYGCDVAVCADALEIDAEAANITLTSHVRLWEQLLEVVADGVGDWTPDSPRRMLQKAQRKCRVELGDRELAGRFKMLIEHRLAPTLAAEYVAKALGRLGLKVTIWGRGWSAAPAAGIKLGGPPDGAEDWNRVYNGAGLTLRPGFDAGAVQMVLDCLAAGGCPICPASMGPLKAAHPELAPALSKVPRGDTPKQWVAQAARLAGDEAARREAIEPARRQVLQTHTLGRRLETLWRITAGQPGPAHVSVNA